MRQFKTFKTVSATKPKQIIIVLSAAAIAACSGAGTKEGTGLQTAPYSIEHIQEIAFSRPEEALALIDTAESRHLLSAFDINDLRCHVYHNGLSRYKTALTYARKAYSDPEARKHPERLLSLVAIMADEAHTNGDYPGSIEYCTEGLELAREQENRTYEANLHVTWGLNLLEMGQYDEAFTHIDIAAGILDEEVRKNPCYNTWDELFYALGMKLNLLYEKDRYDDAAAMRPQMERALHGLEESSDTPEGLLDMRRAETDVVFCCIAYTTGNREEGDRLYRMVEANPFASTEDGEYIRIPCLIMAGRYREALHYIRREKRLLQEYTDTLNWDYINPHLQSELEAYQGIGDWKSAARVQTTMLTLTDSLRRMERHEDALELAEIYKTAEKDMEIERQAEHLRRHHTAAVFLVIIIVLSVIYIWHILRTGRIIKRKNEAMAKTIDELMASKDELFLRQEENISLRKELGEPKARLTVKDRDLYDYVNQTIVSRRLYLQPDFGKKALLKEVHIPANKFASLFKEFAGCSFTQYIQNLRLDHAVRLMKEQPKWTLEAIAKEARMSNGAFYSQFQKKYGMKPSDYRTVGLPAPPETQNSDF